MSYPISKLARDAVRSRLADTLAGWNVVHADVAADYGVSAIAVDFGASSKQFFEGAIDVDDALGSTAARRPVFVLFTAASINTVAITGPLFSGTVQAILQIHIEQRSGNAARDYETAADAVEETLYRLFLDRNWTRDPALTFGGDMSIARGPVVAADANWRQTITARLTFGVHTD